MMSIEEMVESVIHLVIYPYLLEVKVIANIKDGEKGISICAVDDFEQYNCKFVPFK
jgi:hypothetical protein